MRVIFEYGDTRIEIGDASPPNEYGLASLIVKAIKMLTIQEQQIPKTVVETFKAELWDANA